MDILKNSLKYLGASLLWNIAFVVYPHPCVADQLVALVTQGAENENQGVSCGLPLDKLLDDINFDALEQILVLKMLTPVSRTVEVDVATPAPKPEEPKPEQPKSVLQELSEQPSKTVEDSMTLTVIEWNNLGVKALNSGNYSLAIDRLRKALSKDPRYTLAKDNLAIAYNNYGLQQRQVPLVALKYFHQALYLNQRNATTAQNLEGIIRMMGRNPKNPADRVALGDQARITGDSVGAFIEYSAALQLKDDPQTKIMLDAEARRLQPKETAVAAASSIVNTSVEEIDFGPYMADLQRTIKRAWFPPKESKSKSVVVVFKIHVDGSLSDVKIQLSSGVEIADDAALRAVVNAAPFRPLPKGAKENISVQFKFDYNVFTSQVDKPHSTEKALQSTMFDMLLPGDSADTLHQLRKFFVSF